MSREIDFASLSLKDALDLAIAVEDEARERYEEFAHQMAGHHTPEAERFFRFMAENEARHGEELRTRRRELFGDAPSEVDPGAVFEVEAPPYDAARAFMSARRALEVALEAERKAWGFFDRALEHVTDPGVRALFEELREEEVEHQRLVREELDRLPAEPGFDPDDFVDEPTAQ